MIDDVAKSGEKQTRRGGFKPGQSGNPKGKPTGTRNKATVLIQSLLDGEGEAIARRVIQQALSGDPVCLRLCLERLVPPRKDAPIRLELPKVEAAADIAAATGALLSAVGEGEITPGEAQAVAGLLDSHRKALELVEIERRLSALEEGARNDDDDGD